MEAKRKADEEESLLHGLEDRRRHVELVQRDRRDDDDRLGVAVEGGDRLPERDQLRLKRRVAPRDLVRGEAERGRRPRLFLGADPLLIPVSCDRPGYAGPTPRRPPQDTTLARVLPAYAGVGRPGRDTRILGA